MNLFARLTATKNVTSVTVGDVKKAAQKAEPFQLTLVDGTSISSHVVGGVQRPDLKMEGRNNKNITWMGLFADGAEGFISPNTIKSLNGAKVTASKVSPLAKDKLVDMTEDNAKFAPALFKTKVRTYDFARGRTSDGGFIKYDIETGEETSSAVNFMYNYNAVAAYKGNVLIKVLDDSEIEFSGEDFSPIDLDGVTYPVAICNIKTNQQVYSEVMSGKALIYANEGLEQPDTFDAFTKVSIYKVGIKKVQYKKVERLALVLCVAPMEKDNSAKKGDYSQKDMMGGLNSLNAIGAGGVFSPKSFKTVMTDSTLQGSMTSHEFDTINTYSEWTLSKKVDTSDVLMKYIDGSDTTASEYRTLPADIAELTNVYLIESFVQKTKITRAKRVKTDNAQSLTEGDLLLTAEVLSDDDEADDSQQVTSEEGNDDDSLSLD